MKQQPFCVLVTRPKPQGEALCSYLQTRGYDPLFLPVIEIKPIPDQSKLLLQLTHLDAYQWAIFISRSAVNMSAALIQQHWPVLPAQLQIAAVGEGTAEALKAAHLPVQLYPVANWSSEGLLALPEFQQVAGKKIALFCGKGGRELLAATLEKRGALVTPIISYERRLPAVDMTPYVELLHHNKIDALVCTSTEGLMNLVTLFTEKELARLQKIPLVLVSERIMIQAKALGFGRCFVAKAASHDSIFQALQTIRTELMTAPENNETTNVKSTAAVLPKTVGRGTLTLLTALVLTLTVMGGYTYYRSFLLNQKISASVDNFLRQTQWDQHQIADLQNEVLQLQRQVQQQDQTLVHHSQALQAEQGPLQTAATMRKILEAQYFVQVAMDHLLLTSDLPQAISLFKQAEEVLASLNNPDVLPLKKALAEDLTTLNKMPWISPTELYLSLSAIQKQIADLPLLMVPVQTAEAPATATVTPASGWRKGLTHTWEALRQLIVVYHLPSTRIPPFVTPDLRPYIYQNVHATLNDAMWAVLHHDSAVYRASLQQSTEWIEQYFLLSSPLTKTVLSGLHALQAVATQPVKETVLVSPKAFETYLKTGSAPALSS